MTKLVENVTINNEMEHMISRDKKTKEVLFYTEDREYLFDSLSHTLMNQYIHKSITVKKIKYVQHYSGFVSVYAYLNNNVIIEYYIKG